MDYHYQASSDQAARVLLIRHAESRPSPDLPESDWPLSPAGRTQAEALVRPLQEQGVEVVYSSPFRRAIDTIEPFAGAAGLAISINTNLRERKLTPGFHPDWKELIRKAWADFGFSLPGGESGLDCQARLRTCVDALAIQNPGRTIAVASHGNAIALYLNSLDSTFGWEAWTAMKNPDVFSVEYRSAGAPVWDPAFRLESD